MGSLSEAYGEPFPEPLPTLYDLLSRGSKSSNDLAIACLHQPADWLSRYSQSSNQGYLRWNFGQLASVSHACAKALAVLGLRPGSRIVAYLPNCAEYHVLFRAALELNCLFCPNSPKAAGNAAEVQNVFDIAKPDLVVVDDNATAEKLDNSMGDGIYIPKIVLGGSVGTSAEQWVHFEQLMAKGDDATVLDTLNVQRKAEDVILLLMTSGTTSLPKGCPHTNRSVTSLFRAYQNLIELDNSRINCSHLPLSHIAGLLGPMVYNMSGRPFVHPSPYFEPAATLRAIREERATDFSGVPAIVSALLAHPDFQKTDTSCLQLLGLAATTIPPATVRSALTDLEADRVSSNWGMTEGAPITGTNFSECATEPPEKVTCGTVNLGSRICIRDPETGQLCPRGQAGELLFGGQGLINEYWTSSKSSQNANDAFTVDEHGTWLKTGDQAVMDDNGEIEIVGRYKHLIIRGGENISPKSIESSLLQSFGLEADVVGVPDEMAGEVPVAIIKSKPGQDIPSSSVQETLVKELGQGYALEEIIRLDELGLEDFPKTISGKIQKNVLSEHVVKHLNEQSQSNTNGSTDNPGDTTNQIIAVWRKLLKVEKLGAEDKIQDWADSLVTARFPGILQRETGHWITPHELISHNTPSAQADLLNSRNRQIQPPIGALDLPQRNGPPLEEDMIHTHGTEANYHRTRQLSEDTLRPMGLNWQDVQEVIPMYSWQANWVVKRRPQSNNHRFANVASGFSVDDCRIAIENALSKHNLLRALVIQYDDCTPLHIIIRPNKEWFSKCIMVVDPVETAEDLKRLLWNDREHDCATAPGPLFKVALTHIKDQGCAGLVCVAQHSVFDGISLSYFFEDLDALLNCKPGSSLAKRIPFKAWIDSEYNLRNSVLARKSVDWHAKRLAGLHSKKACLFPAQRAPEWFHGDSNGWVDVSTGKSGPDRKPLSTNEEGVLGISEVCNLPHIPKLKQDHGVEPSTLLKAALAMMNSKSTCQSTALMAQHQAARSWPYLQDWQAARLPSAIAVNGPTVQTAVLAVDLKEGESVLAYLQRLESEQAIITQHALAPFGDVVAKLNENQDGDGDVMREITRRQIFNWLPRAPSYDRLKRIQHVSRTDLGLLWDCVQLDPARVQVSLIWDDAQVTPSEARDMLASLMDFATVLGDEASWAKNTLGLM